MLLNLRIVSKVKSILLAIVFLTVNVAAVGCGKNYFEGFATQTDDDSLYWTARGYLRVADYTNAIKSCSSLSTAYLTRDDVAQVCASAYAGRCGYMLTWFTTNLGSIGATPLMLFMMQKLLATTTNAMATDCDSAESILRNIGASTVRSADANMFMAMLAIYKMGVIVNNLADSGTGTLAGGFDACSISAANQQLLGAAMWDLNDSLSQLTSSTFSTIKTAVTALCTALASVGAGENFCLGTSATTLTANQLKGVLSSIKEGLAFGVDQCGGNQSVVTCNCP